MRFSKYILLLLGISIISCSKQKSSIRVKDVSKQVMHTIYPKSNTFSGYTNKTLTVKGDVNGKIKILFAGSEFILEGKIDKKYDADYYGQGHIPYGFLPYEATDGELTITCTIF